MLKIGLKQQKKNEDINRIKALSDFISHFMANMQI